LAFIAVLIFSVRWQNTPPMPVTIAAAPAPVVGAAAAGTAAGAASTSGPEAEARRYPPKAGPHAADIALKAARTGDSKEQVARGRRSAAKPSASSPREEARR
jgi:hypothetical protein